MIWVKRFVLALAVLLVQFILVDFLTIKMIRPDFIVIYIFYFSLLFGRTPGVIMALLIGMITDLAGVGSHFGLSPLTLSVTAYLIGYLKGKYERLLPYIFHGVWISIIGLHFFILSYVRFQTVFVADILEFGIKWLLSFTYTMMFLLIIQFFFPVKEASHAEIR